MNVARIGAAAGRPAGHDRRADHQPLLLVGPAGRGAGGRPHPPRRGRPDAGRRHRIDEHGADDGQQGRADRRACSRTRTSPSPTAWASPPRRSPSNGRSRARSRTPSRWRSHQKALAAIAGRRVQGRDHALRSDLARARSGRQHDRSCASCWSRTTKARARTPAPKGWRSCVRCSATRSRRHRHGRQYLADVRRRRRLCCWPRSRRSRTTA